MIILRDEALKGLRDAFLTTDMDTRRGFKTESLVEYSAIPKYTATSVEKKS